MVAQHIFIEVEMKNNETQLCYSEKISPTLTTQTFILTLIVTVLIVPRVCGG